MAQPRPKVSIGRNDSAYSVATDVISAQIPVARAAEAGILADRDPEFLHDYRIALRKIRSVLSLLKGVYRRGRSADLRARFAALMAPTGRLRDLDVYLQQRQQFYDLLPPELHGGLDRMFGLFAVQRQAEQARLKRHLGSRKYEKEITALAWLFSRRKRLKPGPEAGRGAQEFAGALIWKRYRKICRLAAVLGPETDDAQVHALRIHCKKLRYLMEFFGPLFAQASFKALLKPLKRLQDDLGLVNDHAAQQASLSAFLERIREQPGGAGDEIADSVRALIDILHQRQLEGRRRIFKSLAQFSSPSPLRRFHSLFCAPDQPA